MRFKTDRQLDEFNSGNLPMKMLKIIQFVDNYMLAKYNYEITITDILRTQEEQNNIYKNNPKYKTNPWKSVHQYWRGMDLRTRDMTPDMIKDLEEVLNRIPYDPSRPNKKTCLVHDVGAGHHFHIQVMG